VLCNFTKERRIYEHVWTYFVYNYILVSPGLLRASTSLFFFFQFLKFRNALGKEKTAKLVFIFTCVIVHAFIFVNEELYYVCKFKYSNIFIKK